MYGYITILMYGQPKKPDYRHIHATVFPSTPSRETTKCFLGGGWGQNKFFT